MANLKRFRTFTEQEGGGTGLPTSAPTNVVGSQKIAGLGSDIPPVPAKNKLTKSNIRRRRLPRT